MRRISGNSQRVPDEPLDTEKHVLVRPIGIHGRSDACASQGVDGRCFHFVSSDVDIRLATPQFVELDPTCPHDGSRVADIAYSSDGKTLITANEAGTVRWRDVITLELLDEKKELLNKKEYNYISIK